MLRFEEAACSLLESGVRDVGMLVTYVQLINGLQVEKCGCGYVNICFTGHYNIIISVVCVAFVVVDSYFCMSGDLALSFRLVSSKLFST